MKNRGSYPSTTAAIFALRQKGKTESEIAEELGIAKNSVTSIETRARRRGYGKHGFRTGLIRVSGESLVDFQEEAEARGLTVTELARKVLNTVAADDLFKAVLDE